MQLIGLILLAALAVAVFFGLGERFFRKIGLPDWLAFVLVLALVIGALVPEISLGGITINVGGFLVPLGLLAILFSRTKSKQCVLRSFLAILAVAGMTVATRLLIRAETPGLIVVTSAVTGALAGISAYLAGKERVAVLIGAIGGIVLGDIVNNMILRFVFYQPIELGSHGIFDSIILAAVLGIVLTEAIAAISRTMNENKISRTTLLHETAEDNYFEKEKIEEDKDDFKTLFLEE